MKLNRVVKKPHLLILAVLVLPILLASCSPAASATTEADATTESTAEATTEGTEAAIDVNEDMGAVDPCGPVGTEATGMALSEKYDGFDLSSVNTTIGYLYVGPVDDFGYNYAAHQGQLCLEALFPNAKFVMAENVPENAEAERVMEGMIRRDHATIIFPTSFGHLDPAIRVGERFPDVTFFHMGGPELSDNVGTFFGEIWQMVYASGVAAGRMTKTNKLGYIVAYPIPQTLLNVNAFELGAQSVNPDATTTVVFTSNWCNPSLLAEATATLIEEGIDVVTEHQDCPKPVIEAAARGGIMTVGYHADAHSVAPDAWVTGAYWTWGPTMADLVVQAVKGIYKPNHLRLGISGGVVDLAPFGPNVPEDVQNAVLDVKAGILDGSIFPFEGPIYDQDGNIVIADGVRPDDAELETMDYLVKGVIGTIPK